MFVISNKLQVNLFFSDNLMFLGTRSSFFPLNYDAKCPSFLDASRHIFLFLMLFGTSFLSWCYSEHLSIIITSLVLNQKGIINIMLIVMFVFRNKMLLNLFLPNSLTLLRTSFLTGPLFQIICYLTFPYLIIK
jgi:hypothetical protein